MAYGIIGYSQPGQVNSTAQVGTTQSLISGSIFGDCSSQELTDEGTGFFVNVNFKDTVTAPGIPTQNGTWTFGTAGDSIVNVVYTSTANVIAYVRPMAPIAPNGQTKLWFETSIQPAQTTSQYMFFGFANSTGLSSTLFSTGTALNTSTGLIGFWMHADAPTNLDAVYHGQTVTSTTTVLANVLTANANNPNPANLAYVPTVAPGVFTGSNWVKLGLRTDKQYVYWYVNGSQVAKKLIDSTFDTADSYGAVLGFGTSTATANTNIEYIRTAAKLV